MVNFSCFLLFFSLFAVLILDIQGYKKKIFYIYRLNIVVFLDFSTYQSSSSPSERSKGSNLKVSRQKNVILHIIIVFSSKPAKIAYMVTLFLIWVAVLSHLKKPPFCPKIFFFYFFFFIYLFFPPNPS